MKIRWYFYIVLPTLWRKDRFLSVGEEFVNFLTIKKSKNFEKSIDVLCQVCYNKDTERGKATRKKGKSTRASKTFPTKTLTRKVCRFASNKCEPEPRGWRNVGLCRLQSRSFRNIVKNRAEKSAIFFVPNTFKVLEPTL